MSEDSLSELLRQQKPLDPKEIILMKQKPLDLIQNI
jgi:hypothetical protein